MLEISKKEVFLQQQIMTGFGGIVLRKIISVF